MFRFECKYCKDGDDDDDVDDYDDDDDDASFARENIGSTRCACTFPRNLWLRTQGPQGMIPVIQASTLCHYGLLILSETWQVDRHRRGCHKKLPSAGFAVEHSAGAPPMQLRLWPSSRCLPPATTTLRRLLPPRELSGS